MSQSSYKLSVSLVLYNNNPPLVQNVLQSLINTPLELQLYIVDNSPSKALEPICKAFSGVNYIHSEKNIGFGSAHNIAIKKSNAEYHLVVNPDIYFENNVLPELLKYMDEHLDIGLIAPKVCFPDGRQQYLCKRYPTVMVLFARRFTKGIFQKCFERYIYKFEMRDSGYDKIMDVEYQTGCFMLLRRKYLDKIGYFDEKIFLYFEDADLSLRMYKVHKSIYYPNVTVFHHWERGSYKNLRLTWINIKSAWYFFNKHGWKFF